MFTVKELRGMIAAMSADSFTRQMGPFALVQRPPPAMLRAKGIDDLGGPQRTAMAKPSDISANILGLLFEFDNLMVTTIPPLSGDDSLSVGRLPDCDLVIDHKSVSKRHAVLLWSTEHSRCIVKDSGSTNGTFVNDGNIGAREATLRDGDIVTFGEVPFWYLLTTTLYSKLGSRSGSNKLGARSG